MNDLTPTGPVSHGWLGKYSTLSEIPPATAKQGNEELLACLMLVAPTGMNGEERAGWVQVARKTLTGIPADLLERGCAKARKTCRFASEIVPCIMQEIEGEWSRRKKRAADAAALEANRHAPRLAEPELVDPAEVRKLIDSLGKGA